MEDAVSRSKMCQYMWCALPTGDINTNPIQPASNEAMYDKRSRWTGEGESNGPGKLEGA
jgi:hypothetical protein